MDRITNYLAEVTEHLANQNNLQASGKISVIHGSKKKAFEIGPTVALANSQITFPDAAFNGKSKYGFEAGIATQTRLSKHFSLEVKALYQWLNARFPDESNLYASSLSFHQESIVIPASLMYKVGDMGMDFYLGIGGYYGYVLKSKDYWDYSDDAPQGTDELGFNAYPAGYKEYLNNYISYFGVEAAFWTGEKYGYHSSYAITLYYHNSIIGTTWGPDWDNYMNVRCVGDW